MPNIVEDFYFSYTDLIKQIPSSNLSLQNWAHENFRRVLVLTMANYLENEITNILKAFCQAKSTGDMLYSFVKNKAMTRQYHTYFEWEGRNGNTFFSLFGDDFKKRAMEEVKSTPALDEGIKAFLEIGKTRNRLIHESLYAVDIGNKTAKEFFELFNKSLIFISYLRTKFV
jgi:hypothetical protein